MEKKLPEIRNTGAQVVKAANQTPTKKTGKVIRANGGEDLRNK